MKNDFDIIVALGGGSVIDFAKAYRHYVKSIKKLVAVPTTCGTGSESTQFAVIYIDGEKQSIDEKNILPDYAIFDSQFLEKSSRYLKACTAMDAFCQAIESYWAVKSTNESREYAKRAIMLCNDNIVEYVNTNNKEVADNMSLASHLAGKAINISKTTAAHALSYKITSNYGIPHGHAVALSMVDVFMNNNLVNEQNCIDYRGVNFVKKILGDLKILLGISDFPAYWNELTIKIGLDMSIVKCLDDSEKSLIINSVNVERLSNNPKNLQQDLKRFYSM